MLLHLRFWSMEIRRRADGRKVKPLARTCTHATCACSRAALSREDEGSKAI
jgi:hypothetical protein